MIRRPPRSTQSRSSAASDVYKRQATGTTNGTFKYTVDGGAAVEVPVSGLGSNAFNSIAYLESFTEADPIFVAWRDATRTANTVYAGPTTGVNAIPTFRALVAADIPALAYLSDSTHIPTVTVDFDAVGTDNSDNNAVNTLYSGLVSFPGFTSLSADYGYTEPTHAFADLTS